MTSKLPLLHEIPYSPDSTGLAARLQHLPCPVFLDSCPHNPGGGRFDILSAMPTATLQAEAGKLRSSLPLPALETGDLFQAARQLLASGNAPGSVDNPQDIAPFQGGVLGFVGYPRLQGHGRWRVDEAFLGLYHWALNVDHKQRRSYLIFHADCPPATRDAVQAALTAPEPVRPTADGPLPASTHTDADCSAFQLQEPFRNDLAEADYRQAFARIKAYIDAGDCYQVNLTQRFSGRFSGSPFAAYRRLRQTNGKPFSAYLGWQDKALLSLSPERFLRLEGRQVTTQPIKGTRPRGRNQEEDRRLADALLSSEKDRAENLMIVDLLRNDLGKVCDYGSVQVDRLFELQTFDNVHHLVSTIGGRLRPAVDGLQLLEHCFPGGSITGAPKLRAMEIIEELEPQRRDAYCGSVLYLDFSGRMDSNLTIRTLLCRQQEIFCWAGGGIVADSEADQEYAECFDKIRPLINTLEG